ncbi:hypothetical protein [Microbacterium sp. NPDC055683]
MTLIAPDDTAPEPDPIGQAIAALTAAARRTRTIGPGTWNEHTEPVDFGEIACHVLTAVAANFGGVEELLAGRPGSWEADYVRQIVHSTAGDDPEELLRRRTAPVQLLVDEADEALTDFGIEALHDQELDSAIAREQDESLNEEQAAAAGELADAIDGLWVGDVAAYREAYTAAVRQALTARGLTFGVELVEHIDQLDRRLDAIDTQLTDELRAHARATAPLPMTGEAPDWSEGTPADALIRAGQTYAERASRLR